MTSTYGYIKMIRSKVGHTPIILNAACGIVLNEKNQVLLNLRTDTHNWSTPGGYLEYGETFVQALIREMKEDSGIDVSIIKPFKIFDQGFTKYPNGDECQVITLPYLVTPRGGNVNEADSNETVRLEYFDLDNLPPLLNQQNEDILEYVNQQIKAGLI